MDTIRREMILLLSEEERSVRELSQLLHIREKEVYEHLDHIDRTVAARKKRLMVVPARCMECSYTFDGRKRFTRPGRCPRCKGEHLADPRYIIVDFRDES
ncbi:MAG: ArsR family transcriptional regulator [Deltaproteobacteria bacterium]|jgi:predicted Zn-ribbon and HTH transcriptional regulator|nr:ArsR family transcriptional regulator [Deltaproteobacteria bacterium]